MYVIVSYDVSTKTKEGRRRLRRAARICLNHGQRVQNSVFECLVSADEWVRFRQQLLDLYQADQDSLRFYLLGDKWRRQVEHHGTKPSYDPEGPLIV